MRDLTYPRGFQRIGETLIDSRQMPFDRGLDQFPNPQIDFADLIDAVVPPTHAPPPRKGDMSDFAARSARLAQEFQGKPALTFLTGQLVMILRRRPVPPDMMQLWLRLWEDCTDGLCILLSTRWKISCLQCFADHGRTEDERRIGSEMVMLAALIKIYEAERLYSGIGPGQPHAIDAPLRTPLPMGLEPYSLIKGDIDRHLLARLWQQAAKAGGPVGALAQSVLEELNADSRNVFRRLIKMRAKARSEPQDQSPQDQQPQDQ